MYTGKKERKKKDQNPWVGRKSKFWFRGLDVPRFTPGALPRPDPWGQEVVPCDESPHPWLSDSAA